MLTLTPTRWEDYELIDSGNGEKLERFADVILIRPEPQAIWEPKMKIEEWIGLGHARFEQDGSHGGKWKTLRHHSERWVIRYTLGSRELKLRLALTGFKHVGVFPEQAANWDYIFATIRRLEMPPSEQPRILNLFAYTGGASLAARAAGAQVTHVDSVKQVLTWAAENATLNNWDDLRWTKEDALKFAQREAKRGAKYNGIILDPPAFGHGPKGERWKLEDQLNELMANVAQLADRKRFFLVINAYSLGLSALVLESLLRSHFDVRQSGKIEIGELFLTETVGKRRLPTGVFARFDGSK
jgi:23S rRNA (cytosine1962-C5)-methyltransferase